jgi:hypothetical protein
MDSILGVLQPWPPSPQGPFLLESLCKIDHLFFSVRGILSVMSTAAKFPGWPETDEDIKEQFRRAFGREMTA